MVAKRGKLVIAEDESIKQAYQNYQFLKQEVDNWQQERSSYWLNQIELAEKPPYLPIQDLPSEAIIELWQRLNCAAGKEVSDKELGEIWQKIRTNQNIEQLMDAEMSTRFQMAVCGVAQLAARMANDKGVAEEIFNQSDYPRDSAVCPVCGEVTTLAVVTPPDGKRIMHCNTCGFEWMVKRMICLHCGNEDAKQRTYLKNESYPGFEMVVCLLCGEYSKEIDTRELQVRDYMWEDLRTLPLNFATEFWLSEHMKKDNQIH